MALCELGKHCASSQRKYSMYNAAYKVILNKKNYADFT